MTYLSDKQIVRPSGYTESMSPSRSLAFQVIYIHVSFRSDNLFVTSKSHDNGLLKPTFFCSSLRKPVLATFLT